MAHLPRPVIVLVALLALITGVVHSYIGLVLLSGPFAILFILMGVGYFVGSALLVTGVKRRRWVVSLGMGYVLLLIVAWYLVSLRGGSLANSTLAYADIMVELLLLVFLIVSMKRILTIRT